MMYCRNNNIALWSFKRISKIYNYHICNAYHINHYILRSPNNVNLCYNLDEHNKSPQNGVIQSVHQLFAPKKRNKQQQQLSVQKMIFGIIVI